MRETWVRSLSWEDPLEKEMAIHSSTIARKIPWMEEPGRLQAMGSQRGGHDWATSLQVKADSQCCDRLRCTASDSAIHIHVSILPQLPSHPGCHIHWAEFPVIPSRSLLVNRFKYSSVYMSIPNSLTTLPHILCPWQPCYWLPPSQWDKCKDHGTPVFFLPVWVFMGHIPVPLFLSWFLLVTFPWFSTSHWVLFNNLWVILHCFPSVQFSPSVVSDSLWPQHARLPRPSPTPRVYSNSCLLSRWYHPAISSSVIPFSSCLQSFPASESF